MSTDLLPIERQRCTAHIAATGQPCRAWAIAGGRVCIFHGGRAPQVADKAKRRLAAEALPSVKRLVELRDQSKEQSVAFQAARELLHMAGYQPNSKVQLTGEGDGPLQIIIGAASVAVQESNGSA